MVASPAAEAAAAAARNGRGLRRSVDLFRAFRVEQTEPDRFYRAQAADAVGQLARYGEIAGAMVVDVGGGGGYFTEALTCAGARCVLVEPEAADLALAGPPEPCAGPGAAPSGGANGHAPPDGGADTAARERHRRAVRPGRLAPGRTVAGDGHRLPFPDAVADITFSSNVLEHVPAAAPFLDEMVRVTRPGGLVYLSFTAWYSPWGGHETSPWHYLGGHRAARRYEQRHGRPPGNRYGATLFACHVGPTLRLARRRGDVEVVDALPRYYPDWMRWVVRVPLVREVATWNLLLVLRRTSGRR